MNSYSEINTNLETDTQNNVQRKSTRTKIPNSFYTKQFELKQNASSQKDFLDVNLKVVNNEGKQEDKHVFVQFVLNDHHRKQAKSHQNHSKIQITDIKPIQTTEPEVIKEKSPEKPKQKKSSPQIEQTTSVKTTIKQRNHQSKKQKEATPLIKRNVAKEKKVSGILAMLMDTAIKFKKEDDKIENNKETPTNKQDLEQRPKEMQTQAIAPSQQEQQQIQTITEPLKLNLDDNKILNTQKIIEENVEKDCQSPIRIIFVEKNDNKIILHPSHNLEQIELCYPAALLPKKREDRQTLYNKIFSLIQNNNKFSTENKNFPTESTNKENKNQINQKKIEADQGNLETAQSQEKSTLLLQQSFNKLKLQFDKIKETFKPSILSN